MKNAVNINDVRFDGVEDKVVFDNEIAVSNLSKLVFFWDASKMRVGREQREALFNLCCKRFGGRKPLSGNVGDNLGEIVLCGAEQADVIIKPTHEFSFEDFSSQLKVSDPYRRLPVVIAPRQVY